MAIIKRSSVVVIVFLVVFFGGAGVYSMAESWSYVDSLYFTAVSLTTLGYGDYYPITHFGKVFTIFYSIIGIAITFLAFSVAAKYVYREVFEESLEKHHQKMLKTLKKK